MTEAASITFHSERITEVREEVWPLLLTHWNEIALNKDAVPLNPDWDGYINLEQRGMLSITTARIDGVIVGYASYVLVGNLHYKTMLIADGDIFYLAKEHRKGMTGIKLLRAAEENIMAFARNRDDPFDCVYIINKEKVHFQKTGKQIVGPVLERMGYKLIEHYYAKRVEIV